MKKTCFILLFAVVMVSLGVNARITPERDPIIVNDLENVSYSAAVVNVDAPEMPLDHPESSGTFNPYPKVWGLEVAPNWISAACTGDTDDDGKEEIIFSNSSGSYSLITIYENNGDDTYELVWESLEIEEMESIYPFSICIGEDLDGDGGKEIIVGGEGGLLIFDYDVSEGKYQLDYYVTGELLFTSVCIGDDVDGDGNKEIIAGGGESLNEIVALQYVEDTYDLDWSISMDDAVNAVWTGDDLDGQGDGKEIIVGASDDMVHVLECRGDDSFVEVWNNTDALVTIGGDVGCVRVGDQDEDGHEEIIAGSRGEVGEVHVFEHDGTDDGYEEVWQVGIEDSVNCICTGNDLDGDSRREIVVGCSVGNVTVFECDGDDSYAEEWNSGDLGYAVTGVCTGDLDGDGKKEIIAGTETSADELHVFEHDDSRERALEARYEAMMKAMFEKMFEEMFKRGFARKFWERMMEKAMEKTGMTREEVKQLLEK